jgi:hypothetical protein
MAQVDPSVIYSQIANLEKMLKNRERRKRLY